MYDAPARGDVLPVLDTRPLVKDPADRTKRARLDVGNVSTGTTAVVTIDGDVDLRTGGTSTFQPRDSLLQELADAADDAAARAVIGALGQSDLDAAVRGLDWKASVRAATTAAITLASDLENGDALDGITLATGDRILVKNQGTASENGIYVVAASGAPSRATDADASAEVTAGLAVCVCEGTTQGNTTWVLTTDDPITVGSTSLAFTQLGAGAADDSITNAKLANMAESTIKGRAAGAGTGDPTDLTAAQVRTLLSLVVGTDVQAYHALLASIAGLSLGGKAGYVLKVNSGETGFELVNPYPATTIVSFNSGDPEIDLSANTLFKLTLTADADTIEVINPVTNKLFMIEIIQGGAGSFDVLSWFPLTGVIWKTGDGNPPTLSTTPGASDLVAFWPLAGMLLGGIVGLEEVA